MRTTRLIRSSVPDRAAHSQVRCIPECFRFSSRRLRPFNRLARLFQAMKSDTHRRGILTIRPKPELTMGCRSPRGVPAQTNSARALDTAGTETPGGQADQRVRCCTGNLLSVPVLSSAVLCYLLYLPVTNAQHIAAQWNFNDTASTSASAGIGSYSLLGGVTADSFGGSPSDPTPPASNFALSLTGFPAQAAGAKTAGVGFSCDARWWRDLRLTFDFRGAPSASSTITVLCSSNGAHFFEAGTIAIDTADVFVTGLTLDLAPYTELNHATGLQVRIVSDFVPGTGLYAPIQSGLSYSPAGRWRLDMVTLSGTPEPPRIVIQPEGRMLSVPDSVTLTVVAEGITPLAYQWKHSGTNLPGATGAQLIIPHPTAEHLGEYQAVVSNIGGQCESEIVSLTATIPQILAHPQSQVIDGSGPVTLQVTATGIGPLSYQWFHFSTNLPGQTGPSLTITNPTASDLGAYRVEVSNAGGTTTSDEAVLSAAGPVVIRGPESVTAVEGAFVKLECTATGLLPLTYQWLHNGTNLAGATGATLVLTNVAPSDAGDYFVVVSNAGGAATSSVATVTVYPGPAVSTIREVRLTLDPTTLDVTNATTLFSVEGVVVSHRNLTSDPDTLVFIQDPTAGIAVQWRGGSTVADLHAGDLLRVTGRLLNRDGLLLLDAAISDTTTALVRADIEKQLPSPVLLDLSALPGASELDLLEGSLVMVSNVVMDIGLTNFPAGTRDFFIADFNANVFLLEANSLTDLPGKLLPRKPFVAIGILSQRDGDSPYTNSYAILPTRYSDITEIEEYPFFDQPTVDRREAPNGATRYLGTNPNTALSWQWQVLERPTESSAALLNPATKTPTFTPDQPGRYVILLRTHYSSGTDGAGLVELESLANKPPIISGPEEVHFSEHDFFALCGQHEVFLCQVGAVDPDPLPGQTGELHWEVHTPIGYAWRYGDLCDVWALAGCPFQTPGECDPVDPCKEIGYAEGLAGTNVAVFSVTDCGVPPSTALFTVRIVITADNVPPCVPWRYVWTCVENAENEIYLPATDYDQPSQRLRYQFAWPWPESISGPISFDYETGRLKWRPSESFNLPYAGEEDFPFFWYPPMWEPIPYIVIDEHGASSEWGNLVINVVEVNSPPEIKPIPDLHITEKAPVTLQLEVTDPDIPTNRVLVSLKSGPPGMTFNPVTWQLTWTPGETDGGTTNLVLVEAVDDGVPPLSTNMSFVIIVEKVNEPPRLLDPGPQFVEESEELNLTLVGTDDDLPRNELTFVLSEAPTGMTLDPVSGQLRWRPSEDQGPGVYTVTVIVFDDGTPQLTDTKTFQVTVREANSAPAIAAIANMSIDPGQTLSALCTASDTDVPTNTLTWELVQGPSGATIDQATGQLTWTPDPSQAGQTFQFTVRVTDDGSPPLTDQRSFSVTVNPVPPPDPTGIQWALLPSGFTGRLWGVEYGAGIFVAVGANGTVLTSPDGLVWTQRPTPTTETLWGLKYGCGKFVVAGHNGVILTSTNGIDWEMNPSGVSAHLTDVAFAGETCVVVGNFNTILTSLCGETPWTLRPVATTNHFQDVTYGGGYFVASGTLGLIASSPDGINWAVQNSGTTNGVPMTAYGNSVWLVGGAGGIILKSTNLVDWDQTVPVPLPEPNGHLAGASFANGRFVLVGGVRSGMTGGVVLVSTNGSDWVLEEAGDFPVLYDVAFGASTWVAVGENGAILRSVQLFAPWALNVETTAGGTVERNPNRLLYDDGEQVTITALPDDAHVFTGWSGDITGLANPAVVTVTTNMTVVANFAPKPGYLLTVNVVGQGSVVVAPAKAQYAPGETVEVTAVPEEGWIFAGWSGALSGSDTPASLRMDSDKTVTARFVARPAITTVPDQVVSELATLTLTVTATDPDTPVSELSFALVEAPQGASIGEKDGVFNWTPTEEQGPGTYKVSVRVTDNGTPCLSADTTFSVTVNEINAPPTLGNLGFYLVAEGSSIKIPVTAADPDIPSQTLTFSLDGAPIGAAIEPTTGLFTWTPTEEQGPGSYTITVKVTDNGNPPLSDSKTFKVTVNEVNRGPTLAAIDDRTVNEGELLSFTITANDTDVPAQALSFSLQTAPAGAGINPTTGLFTWTPTEEQGPGIYTITVKVTDNGNPPLSDSKTFKVTVNEVNRAPTLAAIPDRTVNEGELLTFTVTATDPDVPGNTLSFVLGQDAPDGALIHKDTGAFYWRPTEEQGPGTLLITVRVTDNGLPPLDATTSFKCSVREVNQKPVLEPVPNQIIGPGETLTVRLTATDGDLPPNTLTYSFATPAPGDAVLDPITGILTWTPSHAFESTTNKFAVRVTDNGVPELSDTVSFNVVVGPGQAIRLAAQMASSGEFRLQVLCHEGKTLFVETSADLVHWSLLTTVVSTGELIQIDLPLSNQQQCRFYRVVAP